MPSMPCKGHSTSTGILGFAGSSARSGWLLGLHPVSVLVGTKSFTGAEGLLSGWLGLLEGAARAGTSL